MRRSEMIWPPSEVSFFVPASRPVGGVLLSRAFPPEPPPFSSFDGVVPRSDGHTNYGLDG